MIITLQTREIPDDEKVKCTIEDESVENEDGYDTLGTTATCSKCGHVTESFGNSERSIFRCLALMSEECPEGENNFYIEE